MIKEFAIDPDTFKSKENIKFFFDTLGNFKGRLVSRYPRKWKKYVLNCIEELGLGVREEQNLQNEVIDRILNEHTLMKSNRSYNNDLPVPKWLNNAISQQPRNPFDAIITNKKIDGRSDIIDTNADSFFNPNIGLSLSNPLYLIESSKPIKRTADEIARCIIPLLKFSKKIYFIDPYFYRCRAPFINPLKNILTDNNIIDKLNDIDITIITSDSSSGSADDFIKISLCRVIPLNMKINIQRWPIDELHNRYVLSDIGGLKFGHGLDEDIGNTDAEDDVNRLDKKSYERWWDKYSNSNYHTFEIVGEMRI